MRGVIFTILVLFEICRAFPQDNHWTPEPVIIKNGISDRTVYDISSSKEGFLCFKNMIRGIYSGVRYE